MNNKLIHIVDRILVQHTAFETALDRLEQYFEYADGSSEPACLALLGESRTGKSRVIEEFCNRHQKVLTPEGMIIPVIRIRTPSKPTVKGMAELMLQAIGVDKSLNGTEVSKTRRIKKLMKECQTRAIVIEEFNHFVDTASGKVAFYVTDWLKDLADAQNVMLCVSGLAACSAAITQNEQLAGRFSSPIMMPRFDWRKDVDRGEFVAIVSAFEESLGEHFELPDLSGDDMAFRIFCATGGIIGYLSKLLREVVLKAAADNTKVIKFADFQLANEKAAWARGELNLDIDPFCPTLSAIPTEELLRKIATIGVRKEDSGIQKQIPPRSKKTKLRSCCEIKTIE